MRSKDIVKSSLPSVLETLTTNKFNKGIIKCKIKPNRLFKALLIGRIGLYPAALLLAGYILPELIFLVGFIFYTDMQYLSLHFRFSLDSGLKRKIKAKRSQRKMLSSAMKNGNEILFITDKQNDNKIEDYLVVPKEKEEPSELKQFIYALSNNENVFIKYDNIWTIRYQNELTQIKDIKGPNYVHHLISNPEKSIPLSELFCTVNGGDSKKLEAIFSDYKVNDVGGTKEGIYYANNKYDKIIRETEILYKKAKEEDNTLAIERYDKRIGIYKKEKAKLKNTQATNYSTNEREKVRTAVGHSFSSFYKDLKKLNKKSLLKHLKNSIQVYNGYTYQPEDENISWQIAL